MLSLSLTRARTRRTSLLLAVLAHIAHPGIAPAEPSPEVVSASLTLDLNPGCASRADFIARVRARSPRVRFMDGAGGLAIRVQFSTTQSGMVDGDIIFGSPGTKSSVRHVTARNCTQAADAAALIIAVTLDPTSADQHTRAAPSDAAPDELPASDGRSRDRPKAATASDGGKSAIETRTAPASEQQAQLRGSSSDQPVADGSGASGSQRWRGTFGAQLAAEAIVGPARGVMPAIALYAVAGVDRPFLWSPAVVVGVRHAWDTSHEQGGTASFTLDAGTLDACPVRFRLGALDARPCGSVLGGRLSARGTETVNPAAESSRPFWVLGGAALVTLDLTRYLTLTGRVAVGANLVRDSFEFRPATFHTVPAITAAASFGIGVRWE